MISRKDQEDADTTWVEGLPFLEPQDTAEHWLRKGDQVHARLEVQADDGSLHPVVVHNFTVSGINGSRVYGSPHFTEGLSQKDGWRFELLQRDLNLPTTLSEIEAELVDGEKTVLMGKNRTWVRSSDGSAVPVEDIRSFTEA